MAQLKIQAFQFDDSVSYFWSSNYCIDSIAQIPRNSSFVACVAAIIY